MRRLIACAISFMCVWTCNAVAATPAQLAEYNSPIEKVFDAQGYSKAQIYDSAKVWIAETFRSAKAVIEYDNRDEGMLIGNGVILYPCKGALECLGKQNWKVRFTMKVDTKDERFRLTYSNLVLMLPATNTGTYVANSSDVPISSKKDRDKITEALLAFGSEIQSSLGKVRKGDEW